MRLVNRDIDIPGKLEPVSDISAVCSGIHIGDGFKRFVRIHAKKFMPVSVAARRKIQGPVDDSQARNACILGPRTGT